MTISVSVTPEDVKALYSGSYKKLWQVLCGEYLHPGGMRSSEELATLAQIQRGWEGLDLACCTGTGMRFLTRFYGVARMIGVDQTPAVIEEGKAIIANELPNANISFVCADARNTGLPGNSFDFVWSEEAWCHVPDKVAVIHEAARLCKARGTIAFTDMVDGTPGMTDSQAQRVLPFLGFPNLLTIASYETALKESGFTVKIAKDTNTWPRLVDNYIWMLENLYTYDLLKLCNFDRSVMKQTLDEFHFAQTLSQERRLTKAIFVATR